MPVSPATVREAFVQHEPVAHDIPAASGADGRGDTSSRRTLLTRRFLLAAACVAAFSIGFAAVTMLVRDPGSASKPRAKITPTSTVPNPAGAQAPARPAPPTPAPRTSVPPQDMPVAGPAGGASPTTASPAPAPMPGAANSGGPAPSTSAPPPTTSPSTTTPTPTAP